MKKIISLAMAVLMMALVLAAPVMAAPGKGSYGEVPMFKGGIEMDGKIDEAYTEFGLKLATQDYGANYKSDTKCDLYLLHDGEYLYIIYDVKEAYDFDPKKYPEANANASGAWKGAGTELHVDWAGTGVDCAKIMIWADGRYWGSRLAQGKEATYVKEVKTTYDVAAKTYVLEIKMPFVDGAKVGGTIGFFPMITSNNDMAVGGQNHILCTKTDAPAANKAAEFYNVTLSDEEVAFPEAPKEEAKAPATSAKTFDGLAVLAVVAAISGAGVVVSKKR